MEKLSLAVWLILFFGLAVKGQSTGENPTFSLQDGWKSLSENGYSIQYPDTWEVHQIDLHNDTINMGEMTPDTEWLEWCKALYNRFRPELDGTDASGYVDPYSFVAELSDVCNENDVIVPASSGMQSCAMMQAWKVKRGQRILLCNTIGAMGMEPMAIGAAIATGQRVIVTSGDGGFFMNMQELEDVKRLGLNIKYFVFMNGGYGSITTMQDNRFGLRVASDKESGFTLPDLSRTALLFNIPYHEINNNAQLDQISAIVSSDRAEIVRVSSSLDFKYACKVEASLQDGVFVNDDLSNLTPYIDDYERIMAE